MRQTPFSTETVKPSFFPAPTFLQALAEYGGAALLCLVVLTAALRLWRADLSIPLSSKGDSLLTQLWIKGIIENGWYLSNPSLGAPFGQEMHDYPMADGLHFGLMKLIGLVVPDAAAVFNLYYLLTFPLATLAALFVFRRFRISYPIGLTASLLFTFLPFHFYRVEHLFLVAYYLVPLIVLVVIWIYQGWSPWADSGVTDSLSHQPKPGEITNISSASPSYEGGSFFRLLRNAGGPLLICLLVGAAGVYYSFFSCFFLFLAGAAAAWNRRKRAPVLSAFCCIAIICVSVGISLAPSILYRLDHKRNSEAVERSAKQVDLYGLKISQLLLPITDHRLPALAELKERYNKTFLPKLNETDRGSLGLIGSAGFLLLIINLFLRKQGTAGFSVWQCLAFLNVAAVLLATVGGFGSLFGFLLTPLIRGYNRISVFIAFFSFFGIALTLDGIWIYLSSRKWGVRARWALPTSILFVGLFDQTSQAFIPDYSLLASEYRQDAEFVQRVEATASAGARVYQLPYMAFPESWPIYEILHYEPARPYLHSQSLRWSYGAMKGREADLWQRRLREMPLETQLKTLTVHGFAGVWVDRAGYADHGQSLETVLRSLLAARPLESENERYAYFDLAVYAKNLRGQNSDAEWELLKKRLLNPVLIDWHKGFYTPECFSAENVWRWCMRRGEVNIVNSSDESRTVTLQMTCDTPRREPSRLEIDGDLFSTNLEIDEKGTLLEKTLVVPPGKHTIRLFCDAPAAVSPNDNRDLVFRIINFTWREKE
ncbi:MAG: hypothetical protein ACJ8FY_02675 [Gemmataceae bacterium]